MGEFGAKQAAPRARGGVCRLSAAQLTGAALLAAALAGCASSRPAALSLDVLQSRPATGPLPAAALIGTVEAGATHGEAKGTGSGAGAAALYLETNGLIRLERERQGPMIIERRVLVDGSPDDEAAGDEEAVLLVESRYKVDETGALVLVEEINHEEDVEVVFDPPLVVLPPSLAPGETFEQKLSMVVHPMGNRMRTRAAGPVSQRITFEGVERISIPAGEFEAAKVVAVFQAQLNVARVRNTTEEWIAIAAIEGLAARQETDADARPVRLPVLAERREEVQTVLLMPSTEKRLMVLMKDEEE